jgi:hypothetical protein
MKTNDTTSVLFVVAGFLYASGWAFAQTATPAPPAHVPLQKNIGQTTKAPAQVYPSLIVFNSHGASLQGGKLTLTGVSPNAIVFADRPVRAAGHDLTENLLEEWSATNTSKDSFSKDPPNATVSVLSKDAVRDAVVVLMSPKLEGDRLTFDVQVLEGDLAGADGPASVFIDIIGRPLTPLSFAGVARRTAYRGGAYYAGAAAAGALAVGAAAAYATPYAYPYAAPYAAPYAYPYARPTCGYYPYPPCY